MTFKKIVVGLGQSFQDDAIFARALEQAQPNLSQLMMIHTLKPDREPVLNSRFQQQQQTRLDQASTKAHRWLEAYREQAIAQGISTQIDCRSSDPGLWICEVAQRWGADLIVMGHRANQGAKSAGANSVTQYMLQHAPCDVLVVNSSVEGGLY
jgi:nucleotide-binding universal stress UspA family protein